MKRFALILLALVAIVCCGLSCGSSSEKKFEPKESDTLSDNSKNDTETEQSSDTDDTGSAEESDGTESTDSPLDLNDAPSDLPSVCRLHTEVVAGEDVGRFPVSAEGDARYPDVAIDPNSGEAVIVWGYIGDDIPTWRIQATRYDIKMDNGEIERELGDIQTVTSPEESPLSEYPSVALSEDGYMVVFRDARYDETCDTTITNGYQYCIRSISLLSLDKNGLPTMDDPIRLSEGITKGRPSIARVPNGGYVIAWNEIVDDMIQTKAVRVSDEMEPSDVMVLEEDTYDHDGPSVACNDKVAIVVYATDTENEILASVWPHAETKPNEDAIVVGSEIDNMFQPRIVAGDDGFMVSYNGDIASQAEVFLQPLDETGEVKGDAKRATWALESAKASELAWNGETYAMVWESSTENGVSKWPISDVEIETLCAYENCSEQIFATLVKTDGTVASEPVMLSRDINRSERSKIIWDGVGWTVVWQGWRELRWQVFHGQMLCD